MWSPLHCSLYRKEYCSEDIPDIEDIWTSSFIDQIPQLDGAGDKDPPPSTCQLLTVSACMYCTVSVYSSLYACVYKSQDIG